LSLYANGEQPDIVEGGDTGVDSSGDISSGEVMWIGESTDETGTAMMGDMDDLIIFANALAEDDIPLIYGSMPQDGAVDVEQDLMLRWPSESGSTYDVYLGINFDDVNDANSTNPLDVLVAQGLETNNYTPDELLEKGRTYYWRVDVIGTEVIKGDVQSFQVMKNYVIVVEDFENYTDFEPDTVWLTWIDGYDVPTNGASAGYPNPDFIAGEHYLESQIVHGGEWSLPLVYDNSVGLSEITRTLNADWTQQGVATLSLYYRGGANNAVVPMFVALNGDQVVTNPDENAVQASEWARWDISLQAFSDMGVNLSNVGSMSIGFGNKANPVAGGSGTVFFDDIRLALPDPE
jgi:hypothetical protein